jgi:hypothetical protein
MRLGEVWQVSKTGQLLIPMVMILSWILLTASPSQARLSEVSDSLVERLSCTSITPDSIRKAIREDAFSSAKHNPTENWGMWPGLANCWSMARLQRVMFLMGRTGVAGARTSRAEANYVLDIARGAKPIRNAFGQYNPMFHGVPFTPGRVIETPTENVFTSPLFEALKTPGKDGRNLKSEIEIYQFYRFTSPGNLKFLEGESARSVAANLKTAAHLILNAMARKLTLVILRGGRTKQHVVLVKRVERSADGGSVVFWAYDANQPEGDVTFRYDRAAREFFAPEIIDKLKADPSKPVGVYITDESERDRMELALVKHYINVCGNER